MALQRFLPELVGQQSVPDVVARTVVDPKLPSGTPDNVVKTMTQLWEKKTTMGGPLFQAVAPSSPRSAPASLPGRRR